MIVYSDETFELITFGFSIKTTLYRKFNEIADRIESDKIVSILFVTEMYIYEKDKIENLDSRERIRHAESEILAFYMIDRCLATRSHAYDTVQIDDFKYIATIMFGESRGNQLPTFMAPVAQEFDRLNTISK